MRTRLMLFAGAMVLAACIVIDPPWPSATVVFNVTPPAGSPAGAGWQVIGNLPALGNGAAPGLALTDNGAGVFTGQLPNIYVGTSITYHIEETNPVARAQVASADQEATFTVAAEGNAANTQDVTVEGVRPLTPPTVTFTVTIPSSTPSTDNAAGLGGTPVCIVGDQPEIGAWNAAATPLTAGAAAHTWTKTITFSTNLPTSIQYKFTLCDPSWNDVEKAADCSELANRVLTVTGGTMTQNDTVAEWRNSINFTSAGGGPGTCPN